MLEKQILQQIFLDCHPLLLSILIPLVELSCVSRYLSDW